MIIKYFFGVYNHQNLGKINVITVLDGDNSEIARDVAMHVAAMNPGYLSRSDVPEDVINHEKDVLKKQAIEEGKNLLKLQKKWAR